MVDMRENQTKPNYAGEDAESDVLWTQEKKNTMLADQ